MPTCTFARCPSASLAANVSPLMAGSAALVSRLAVFERDVVEPAAQSKHTLKLPLLFGSGLELVLERLAQALRHLHAVPAHVSAEVPSQPVYRAPAPCARP